MAPGELVALLGPNGSGKSTLLRLLATDLSPDGGGLRLFQRELRGPLGELRRAIGYAPDEAAHLEPLSGLENAVLFGRMAGLSADRARREARDLLDRFGLAGDAGARVESWSFGMRRKLVLAEAFLHQPRLLLLDEPTVGLDPPSLSVLRELLRERLDDGAAAVLATNDAREAGRIASRVVFLHRGEVILNGAPADLLDQVGSTTRIEIEIRGSGAPGSLELPGSRAVEVTADRIVATARDGARALPRILEALLARDVSVRSVRIREPHLGDVFRQVTGEELARNDQAADT